MVIALGGARGLGIPSSCAVSALTLAELASGPVVADGRLEAVLRQELLRIAVATFETLSFDSACAHAYRRVYAAVVAWGRKPRGSRVVDCMIAATALAHGLPLYTCDARDLGGLEGLIEIVDLSQ